jgi:hypothetical protein
VVPVPVCGHPVVRGIFGHVVVMEIILAWLWLVGLVVFLVLVGYLFRGRRNDQSSRGAYYLEARLLPDHLEFFPHRNELGTLQPNRLQTPSTSLVTPPNRSSSLPILGNKRSQIYHRSDCPSYGAISPKNRVAFPSPQDAEQAGYILAGNCPH